MCIDINVSLPTVNKFLLLYSLRCGCIITLLWTSIRSFLCCVFCIFAIPEVLTGGDDAFSHYPFAVPSNNMTPGVKENMYYIYMVYIVMLITDAVLFAYSMYSLTVVVCHKNSDSMRLYLVCRFLTWMTELAILFLLSLIHGVLIGWHLIMLMIIILEFYGFAIVYSYYRDLIDEEYYSSDQKICEESQCPRHST